MTSVRQNISYARQIGFGLWLWFRWKRLVLGKLIFNSLVASAIYNLGRTGKIFAYRRADGELMIGLMNKGNE